MGSYADYEEYPVITVKYDSKGKPKASSIKEPERDIVISGSSGTDHTESFSGSVIHQGELN